MPLTIPPPSTRRPLSTFLAAVRIAAAFAGVARAADTNPLHTGGVNLDVIAGWSVGGVGESIIKLPVFNSFRVNGAGSEQGGLAGGVSLHPRLLFTGEVALLNGEHRSRDLGGGYTASWYTRAAVYDADFQYRFQRKAESCEHKREPPAGTGLRFSCAVPYVEGGLSTVQNRANVLVEFSAPPPVTAGTVLAGATSARVHEATFAFNAGAGFRYYLSRWFGIRIGARGYFPTGLVRQPFARFSGGIFFQVK